MTTRQLEDLEFFAIYKDFFPIRRWEKARIYRYCLLIPVEIGSWFSVSILDPSGFELFLDNCYDHRFQTTADALTAAIKAVDLYISESLHEFIEDFRGI
ncbi:MAG: hypothetical protein AAGF24_05155 [Cyanobacteria bacterium P01_H01_bin.121]